MKQLVSLILMIALVLFSQSYAQTSDQIGQKSREHAQKGEWQEAEIGFQKIKDIGKYHDYVRIALKIIKDVSEKRIKPKTAMAIFKGDEFADKSLFDDAITQYKIAINLDPKYAIALIDLGTQYGHKGQYDEAVAVLEKAITLDPNEPTAYNNLGGTFIDKGDYKAAVSQLETAIVKDPKCSNAYSNLGSSYNRQGLYDKAIKAFMNAVALDPEDATSYNNMAIAYYKKGSFKEAIKHCDRAISLGYSVHPGFLAALKPYRSR